jgi:hypothetical protein
MINQSDLDLLYLVMGSFFELIISFALKACFQKSAIMLGIKV